jgi:hypothetical protein
LRHLTDCHRCGAQFTGSAGQSEAGAGGSTPRTDRKGRDQVQIKIPIALNQCLKFDAARRRSQWLLFFRENQVVKDLPEGRFASLTT